MNKIHINFDVSRGGIQRRIFVKSGDCNSRTVIAKFYSGGVQIGFENASLRMVNAYGAELLTPCIVSEDAAIYTFKTEELSCGEMLCEFVLRDGDAMLTSPRFIVMCEELLFDGEGAESSNEYAEYIAALARLENLSVSAESGDAADAAVTVGETDMHIAFTLPRGADGSPGADGYTPQRGVDYWTEADIAEIKSYVDEAVLGGEW